MRVLLAAALAAAAVAVAGCGQKAAEYGGTAENWPVRDLRIMAPAEPGGGWDATARAMAQAIERGKVIDKNVEVYNVAGAGGTIGLAQLVSRNRRRANELMVMGLVMVGAIATNDAPVGLGDVTPIASLTTEPEAIVVRDDSPYRDVDDLVADLRRDPRKVAFAGGSAGGTDQILVGLVAKAAKVDPSKPKYVAYSGGGEAASAILSGAVDAGVSGVSEWADQIEAGKMRFLAVSTRDALEVGGESVPSLREQGLDVEVTNWRGIVAPPDISSAERDRIIEAMEELHATPGWKDQLERNEWTDFFLTGDRFTRFMASETRRARGILQQIGLVEAEE